MGVAGIALTYDKITGLVTKAEAVTAYNSDGEATAKIAIREYSYNHMNQVSEIKDYTDFLNDTSKYMIRSYGYDDLGRPVSIEYTDNMSISSSDIKQAHYYAYDKNYNIIEERIINKYGQANGAVPEETRSYEYDQHGRLVSTSIEKMGEAEEFDEETGEAVTGTDNTYIEQIAYEYDAAGNRTKVTKDGEETDYSYNGYNQLTSAVTKKLAEGVEGSDEGTEQTEGSPSAAAEDIISSKTYTYDKNGNQLTEADSKKNTTTAFRYDADNRLTYAQGKTGDTVEYTQDNEYNGFGQRILKKEGTEETNYFYDGTQVLYTTDETGAKTSFNIIGAEDNILTTARFEGDVTSFYTYTKDLRESTVNLIGSDGLARVSYEYGDFGEITEYQANIDDPFYNEVCYSGGIYDDTTGLYYLNARHYDPADAIFLTQDTYRGDRSRTYTLNYYAYCAGNPISYTDPTGHWAWAVVGAISGAYDGIKYSKKKKLKGVKKAAAIIGGAALGAINPFKVVKGTSKAGKIVKGAVKKAKALKNGKKIGKAAKATKGKTLKVVKPNKKLVNNRYSNADNKIVKKASNGGCFVAGTKIHTKDGFKNIEAIKVGDYVWSEDPVTKEKALKSVKKIFVREKDSIIRLSINGEIIETTDEHPFYVEGRGFVAAAELKAGDEVSLFDNEEAYIDSIEELHLTEPIKVYNFEVEDFHTYYVSEQKVLVHNTCAVVNNTPKTIELYDTKQLLNGGGTKLLPPPKEGMVADKLIDNSSMSTNDVLDLASEFLGKGYTEQVHGSGRFVSADGTRVFRMGKNDILGKHGGGPHVNFEILEPNPLKPGKMRIAKNIHIYLND